MTLPPLIIFLSSFNPPKNKHIQKSLNSNPILPDLIKNRKSFYNLIHPSRSSKVETDRLSWCSPGFCLIERISILIWAGEDPTQDITDPRHHPSLESLKWFSYSHFHFIPFSQIRSSTI